MAKNTIKITTKVTGMKDVQKALLEIEKQFNMLVSQIHSPAEKALPETSGRTGDIQIVENVDKSYTFELKTNKGWRIPYIGDSPIVFKSKDKVNTVKKSIDEIEADDTNSGGRLAKTTIYDEKNDKFVMPRADYDSGWWTWDWSDAELLVDNPYVLTHNLGVIPTQYMILFAPDGSITGGTAMEASRANPTISGAHGSVVDTSIIKWAIPLPPYGHDHDWGVGVALELNDISLVGGTAGSGGSYTAKSGAFNTGTNHANYVDGYMRVLLWK